MRVLALADEAPGIDAAELVDSNRPDAVITLGDLERGWLASLSGLELPLIGVHGNHDGEGELEQLGICDLHLDRAEIDSWSFSGFEGCVRYRAGSHQFTQAEATKLVGRLPAAEVLICHAPPWGVNDEPADPVHVGFRGLRTWVESHEPRYLLHGHTQPDPRTRTHRLGPTKVVWVRGALLVDLER